MIFESCIFDTTVFNYFAKLKCVDFEIICRALILKKVLVPSHIVVELEKFNHPTDAEQNLKIVTWINEIPTNTFYHYCDAYDILVFEEVRKRLDIGETAAIAQARKGVFTGVLAMTPKINHLLIPILAI